MSYVDMNISRINSIRDVFGRIIDYNKMQTDLIPDYIIPADYTPDYQINNLPTAPTKEKLDQYKQNQNDLDKIPMECTPVYTCPYCGHIMYTYSMWNSIDPAPIICTHCDYRFVPPKKHQLNISNK